MLPALAVAHALAVLAVAAAWPERRPPRASAALGCAVDVRVRVGALAPVVSGPAFLLCDPAGRP